ncbi:MAG: PilN domain-containing protein [bacterium]
MIIKINLNKEQKSRKLKVHADKSNLIFFIPYLIIPIVAAAAAIYFMQYFMQNKINNIADNISSYNSKISVLMPKVQKVVEIRKVQSQILQKINIIKTLKKEQQGPIGYTFSLTSAIPKFAWLSSLKSDNGNISISGVALDGQVVSMFMKKIKKTGFFHSINLIQTAETKKQDLKLQNFSLTMEGKYKKPKHKNIIKKPIAKRP